MVLTRAGMPHIKHALIFFPHWRLGVKTVSSGVKMGIAPFHINHKADITEVTCFSGGVKAEEGDTTFIDGLLVLQIRPRSEEHTSELQSRFELVCRLLLETKKKTTRRKIRAERGLEGVGPSTG